MASNKNYSGYFITLEGGEGAGKSSAMPSLRNYCEAINLDVLLFKEPEGTDIGKEIGDVLHTMRIESVVPRAELLLYLAARAQNVDQVIRPHLEKGGIVISDRFFDSTIAYQSYGRGLPLGFCNTLIEFATNGLRPDLTVLMDIDPEVGLNRRLIAARSGGAWTRMDAETLDFHERIREGYLKILEAEPERLVRVDANEPLEVVIPNVLKIVENRLTYNGFIEGNSASKERRG